MIATRFGESNEWVVIALIDTVFYFCKMKSSRGGW